MNQYVINVKRNIKFGIFARVAQILFPFVIRRFIVQQLGIEYIGVNGLFGSIFSILSLAELGIGGALTYMFYKPIAENDQNLINGLMNLYKKCYMVIGLVVLVLGILVIPFLPFLVKDGYPTEINIYIIYTINLVSVVLPYWIYAYEISLISAYQREDVLLKVNLIMFTIQSVIQIFVLLVFSNYYIFILVAPIISIIANLIVGYWGKRLFCDCRPTGEVPKVIVKEIKNMVKGILFHKIGGITFGAVDGIVISAFIGLSMSGAYNNYWSIPLALSGVFDMLANSFRATLGNLAITKSLNENYNIFMKVDLFFSILLGWGVVCMLCIFQPFICIWLGAETMLENSVVLIILITFYFSKANYTVELYKSVTGLWLEDRYRPIVMSIVNIILSVIFAKYLGIFGVVLATALVVIFVSIPWETKILFSKYFKSGMARYYVQKVSNTVLICIISVLAYFASDLVKGDSVWPIIIKLCICSSIYLSIVLLLYMNKIKMLIKIWRSEKNERR